MLKCLACGCRISREGLKKTVIENNPLVDEKTVIDAFKANHANIECFRCDWPYNWFVEEEIWEKKRQEICETTVQLQLDLSKGYQKIARTLDDNEASNQYSDLAEKYRKAAKINKEVVDEDGDQNIS